METNEEFLNELTHMVSMRASSEHLVDTIAFIKEISERLQDDPIYGEFDLAEDEGKFKNKNYKIHGFTEFDESDGTIGLVIGKWFPDSSVQTLTSSDVSQLFSQLETFVNASIKNNEFEKKVESSGSYRISVTLAEKIDKLSRIRLHLFSNGILSQRFKEKLSGSVNGVNIEQQVWDLVRIKSLYESFREREAIQISLNDFNSAGIPCLEASISDKLNSYLCVVNASLLADLFERYGSRLLEGNVRSFLGSKGGVNKGIKKTIKDDPALFFAYNNGIAATATNASIVKRDGGLFITGLSDLQIVNGGQTTASILSARKNDRLSLMIVNVQMKLTVVDINEANLLIPKIAEYANTQNKVAIADFFANHPIHRKLEELSRRLRAPVKAGSRLESKWFYERFRGQYQNERLYLESQKKNFFDLEFPSKQVINKTDLAKYDSALRLKPFWISQGAQKNFLKFAEQFESSNSEITQIEYWETISPNFGDSYYEDIAAIAIIWKRLENIISSARNDWYEGDYRSQIAAYTLSFLFYSFRFKDGEFDLKQIWLNQDIDDVLASYLVSIAIKTQGIILSPPKGSKNSGEWAKKDACWEAVKKLPIDWNNDIVKFFVNKNDAKFRKAQSKETGIVDDSISNQKLCLEHCLSGYYDALCKWDKFRNIFSPSEQILIKKISTQDGFLQLNTNKDWKIALFLRDKAHDEGFRYVKKIL